MISPEDIYTILTGDQVIVGESLPTTQRNDIKRHYYLPQTVVSFPRVGKKNIIKRIFC